MTIGAGWRRLWLIFATVFLLLATWSAMSVRDIRSDIGNKTCVIGSSITTMNYDRLRNPTDAEIATARAALVLDTKAAGRSASDADLDFNARTTADLAISRSAEYVECVSLERLANRLLLAILATLVLLPILIVARWVLAGFRKQAH